MHLPFVLLQTCLAKLQEQIPMQSNPNVPFRHSVMKVKKGLMSQT